MGFFSSLFGGNSSSTTVVNTTSTNVDVQVDPQIDVGVDVVVDTSDIAAVLADANVADLASDAALTKSGNAQAVALAGIGLNLEEFQQKLFLIAAAGAAFFFFTRATR